LDGLGLPSSESLILRVTIPDAGDLSAERSAALAREKLWRAILHGSFQEFGGVLLKTFGAGDGRNYRPICAQESWSDDDRGKEYSTRNGGRTVVQSRPRADQPLIFTSFTVLGRALF
jgi:hypothetical protein